MIHIEDQPNWQVNEEGDVVPPGSNFDVTAADRANNRRDMAEDPEFERRSVDTSLSDVTPEPQSRHEAPESWRIRNTARLAGRVGLAAARSAIRNRGREA